MADFSKQVTSALNAIAKKGGDVTISRTPQTIPDANKPWRKTPAPVNEYTVKGVTLEFKRTFESQGFTAGSEDSTAILPGDMKVLIAYKAVADAANSFPIEPGHFVNTALGKFVVIAPHLLAPDAGATPILYTLPVRK